MCFPYLHSITSREYRLLVIIIPPAWVFGYDSGVFYCIGEKKNLQLLNFFSFLFPALVVSSLVTTVFLQVSKSILCGAAKAIVCMVINIHINSCELDGEKMRVRKKPRQFLS
ncbi:hypothetical protein TWF481_012336 [Arthrobotrys musiformis]|uniref:Uncharacterized protein n=1 Tax=Arthrobotrys musiformis TaxID=47236 RepID=A0AAV9W7N9_9PEZI